MITTTFTWLDWTHFTPWSALFGGLLIGLACTVFIVFTGRILGISGIVGGLFSNLRIQSPPFPKADVAWRLYFLLGLCVAPWAYRLLDHFIAVLNPTQTHSTAPIIETNTWQLIVAGLLVGIGTRYGSGCTSGHGVCGLSRLSPRSLVATLAFMTAGFLTVYCVQTAF